MHDGISGSFGFNDKSGIFTFLSPMFSNSSLQTNTPSEWESMDVFLFYVANFSNNGTWLILEIICLEDLLVDLFTEQGRMDDVCKFTSWSPTHCIFLQTDEHLRDGSDLQTLPVTDCFQ